MSPKKAILRELTKTYEATDGKGFTRPSTISGFDREPERYQKAVNELLQERLVDGHKDDDGKMTIAINVHRLAEVRRELRPIWAKPAVWVALVLVAAAAVFGLGLGA